MNNFYQEQFIYTSELNKAQSVSKIEQFMQKVEVAKDIAKLKALKRSLLPHYKKLMGSFR